MDTSTETIKNLFYKQIKDLTAKTVNEKMRTFDVQFSDRWVQ